MAERLTEKHKISCFEYDLVNFEHKVKEFNDYDAFYAYNMAVRKLGKLEDILEKYGIESVEELECLIEQTPKFIVKETSEKYGQEINGVFFSNEQMLILSQYNELQEPYKKRYEQVKINRDIWKRACELACKWFKQTGFIGDQTKVDYFYQQAKKEENDE